MSLAVEPQSEAFNPLAEMRQQYVDREFADITDVPKGLNTQAGLEANFTIVEKREEQVRTAQSMTGFYSSIDSQGFGLKDALALAYDLENQPWNRTNWGPNSGALFDGLLGLSKQVILGRLRSQGLRGSASDREHVEQIDAYLVASGNRSELDPLKSINPAKLGEHFNTSPASTYLYEYLRPLNYWRPEQGAVVSTKGEPLRLVEEFEEALDKGTYPLGSKEVIHKTHFGRFFAEEAGRMRRDGFTVRENGLISYPQFDPKMDSFRLLGHYDSFARYVADMANGLEHTPKDAYHLANFGIVAIFNGERLGREESVKYFSAAQKAIALARRMAKATLEPEALADFEKSLEGIEDDIPWPYVISPSGEPEGLFNLRDEIVNGVKANGGWVNAHLHLDRADSLTATNFPMVEATLQEKWGLVDQMKRDSTVGQIYGRMARTLEDLMAQNVQAVGTFIDVDPVIGDKAIRAAQRLRDTYGRDVDIKFINQALKGVLDPEAQEWFLRGAEFADIIGGLPGRDKGREEEHIELLLRTAKDMGKMAHVHVDQFNDPDERETETLARKTIEYGMQGRVMGVHGISIGAQPLEYRQELYRLMNEAGMGLVVCPKAWLDSPRNEKLAPTHNSIAPVGELMAAGVTVALGSDNTRDIYLPGNTANMWEELDTLSVADRYRNIKGLVRIGSTNGLAALGISK